MNKLQNRVKSLRNAKGFTLVELIVVIVIIGLLAAVLVPRLGGFTDKAKAAGAISEAKQVATALEAYYAENGTTTTPTLDSIKDLFTPTDSAAVLSDVSATGTYVSFKYTVTMRGSKFEVTRDASTGVFDAKKVS